MENELIISIYNPLNSNNANEDYQERDPFIVDPGDIEGFDNIYRFQGYQVYQIVDEKVSPTELNDVSKARLVFQCDIRDSISRLVNYTYDDDIGREMPEVMVEGENEGLTHSFNVKEDLFAVGDRNLVNFKRYYFMAVAYASNQFKKYDPDDASSLDGQKAPYLGSRKGAVGEIVAYEGIPHSPNPENGGTVFSVPYGYELPITRIDGWGNGGRWTDIDPASELEILAEGEIDELTYQPGAGPIEIKVVDPLSLPANNFDLYFTADDPENLDTASRYLVNLTTNDTIYSNYTMDFSGDQLIPD